MSGEFTPREKGDRPSVGFTGWASVPLFTRIKIYYKELPILLASLVDSKRFAEHKGFSFEKER